MSLIGTTAVEREPLCAIVTTLCLLPTLHGHKDTNTHRKDHKDQHSRSTMGVKGGGGEVSFVSTNFLHEKKKSVRRPQKRFLQNEIKTYFLTEDPLGISTLCPPGGTSPVMVSKLDVKDWSFGSKPMNRFIISNAAKGTS